MHLFTTIHVNLSTLLIGMFFALVGLRNRLHIKKIAG